MPLKPPTPEALMEAASDPLVVHLVDMINQGFGTDIDVSDENSRAKYAFQIQRIQEAGLKARADVRLNEFSEVSLPFLMNNADGETINFCTHLRRAEVERLTAPFSPSLQNSISVWRPLKLRMPG